MRRLTVSLTEEQLDTVITALEWYADDRRESAKSVPDPDRADQEAAANTADGIRAMLEGVVEDRRR